MHPLLTIQGLRARAVNVPLAQPLQTSSGVISTAPLVLVDLQTHEGIIGHSYIFCYTALALKPVEALVNNLAGIVREAPVAPQALDARLQQRFRLLGPQGLVGMAMAGIDMAAWDALASAANMPLARLLGGELRPVKAYNSLGMNGVARAVEEAEASLGAGFQAIKVKIGYPELATDLEVIHEIRRATGDHLQLMVDYNQSLSVPEAIRRTQRLDEEGLAWIEEPTLADDFAGHARIAREIRTPVQLGENWWGPHDMAKSLAAGASDLAMPDVMKIGGVTGWLRAAALAEAAGVPVSNHIFPEISAHLMLATPTCHWLEYMDLANPILATPLKIEQGHALLPDQPGCGINWDEEAVTRYQVD